jgi:hypothetical protein
MKKTVSLFASVLLLSVLTVSSYVCKDVYSTTEEVFIQDMIENTGINADCNLTLYNLTGLIYNTQMSQVGLLYYLNLGTLEEATYSAEIYCNKTINATHNAQYISGCTFKVNPEEDGNMYVAIGIIMLGVIGLLLLISERFTFFFFEKIPIMKYLVYLVGGWLLVASSNVIVRIVEIEDSNLVTTISGFYAAVMYIMIFITSMWLIGLIYYSLNKIFEWTGGKDA